VLASYVYSYDLVGNKTKVEELGGRVVSYTYDELYRLTKEEIVDPMHGDRTMEYVYDAVGNRLLKKDTAVGDIVYRYNQNDWLLDESMGNAVVTAYTYDNNGNTKTRTARTEITNYLWDTQNRLTSASVSDHGVTTQQMAYEYNVAGVRTKSTMNNVETHYLLDENRQYAQVLEEYDSSGVQSRYIYGAELDLISQTLGTATSYYLKDGHSGVRQLTSTTGTIADQYGYDGYGKVIYSVGSTQNTCQYRGEQSDTNLGMQYLRARYYNTEDGRFASVDLFEGYQSSPVSRHRYTYGNNNPVNYGDPSGKFSNMLELMAAFAVSTALIGAGQQLRSLYEIGQSNLKFTEWKVTNAALSLSTPVAYGIGLESITVASEGDPSGFTTSQDFFAVEVTYGLALKIKGREYDFGSVGGANAILPSIYGYNPSWFSGCFSGINAFSFITPLGGGDIGVAYMGYGLLWDFPENPTGETGISIGSDVFSGIIVPASWPDRQPTPGNTISPSPKTPNFIRDLLIG
jgi:RHS repeat-associated protein